MVNRSLAIGIGILIVVALGFLLISSMTGNVITGAVVGDGEVVESESFRISDFGSGINEEGSDGAQDSSGSG